MVFGCFLFLFFWILQIYLLADLPSHKVLLSSAPIKHLCLFSGSQAFLFLSKERPCACPSNLESNGWGQSEADGVSLWKKESRIEWENGRKNSMLGARWIFIIWKFIFRPLSYYSNAFFSVFCLSDLPFFVWKGLKTTTISDISAKYKSNWFFFSLFRFQYYCCLDVYYLIYHSFTCMHLLGICFLLVQREQGPAVSQWQWRVSKVESQMRSRCTRNQLHGVWFCKAAFWRRLS